MGTGLNRFCPVVGRSFSRIKWPKVAVFFGPGDALTPAGFAQIGNGFRRRQRRISAIRR
jgi:hypothetical protein